MLGADLQAVLVDDFAGFDLAGFAQGDLRLLSPAADGTRVPGSLLDKVEAAIDLSPWLGQVKPVESLEQALAQRGQLGAGESLISRDGYWVGRHFLRVCRASEAQSGVLARGQEIVKLIAEREEREATLESLETELQTLRATQRQQETGREHLRRLLQDEARQQGELKAQLSASKAKAEQLTLRRTRLDEEVAEMGEQRALEHEQIGEARLQLQEALDSMALDELRVHLNEKHAATRGKLTLLPFIVRAMVVALRDFPQINARYDDEAQVITRLGAVHVGVATQSDVGLMVPVVRHAEARSLWGNAEEIARLATAARNGKASRDELSGSTITLTSLGALGGIVSTPVLNLPEVAIVGVNRIVERPMVIKGQIVIRKMMNLSSSFDHRVVDGMDAAQFIQAIRGLLEQPASLFLE
ncbi:2-oxo acid dehydrogenase subunit E2 [Pseudomonas emilianonis]|uniref:2-oxo acid dehydrogenase subunit E2 n=1 Tax=Pseudomonas emilianonis TaxID=2915812 RepID=UPI0031F4C4C8